MTSQCMDYHRVKHLIAQMIEAMAFELDVEIQGIGSTTITSRVFECGFEPDEAYYIANEATNRDKMLCEPDIASPPDLVLEVEVEGTTMPRLPILASLRVPEVWHYTSDKVLCFYKLTEDLQYEESPHSVAFPLLEADDVITILQNRGKKYDNQIVHEFLTVVRGKMMRAR